MNYKLEKFWNEYTSEWKITGKSMNYKLEKFWNPKFIELIAVFCFLWTINLKSFEICMDLPMMKSKDGWTINLKSFEICLI